MRSGSQFKSFVLTGFRVKEPKKLHRALDSGFRGVVWAFELEGCSWLKLKVEGSVPKP